MDETPIVDLERYVATDESRMGSVSSVQSRCCGEAGRPERKEKDDETS